MRRTCRDCSLPRRGDALRELVYNDGCAGGGFKNLQEAVTALVSFAKGISYLHSAKCVSLRLRLTAYPAEIELAEGVSLATALQTMLSDSQNRSEGVLLSSVALQVPVEGELSDTEFGFLIDYRIQEYPEAYGLLLCAISERLPVVVAAGPEWARDELDLTLVEQIPGGVETTTLITLDHVYSEASARSVRARQVERGRKELCPSDFWRHKEELFPDLRFGLGVQKDISRLSDAAYESALSRLSDLQRASSLWRTRKLAEPPYTSRVTGESGPTMDKFGAARVFKDANGDSRTFEKHARLANGYRIHLIEHVGERVIEIGYIGPHLRTVNFPS